MGLRAQRTGAQHQQSNQEEPVSLGNAHRGLPAQGCFRVYSPRKAIVQVLPSSNDFSHSCSTRLLLRPRIVTRFRTVLPSGSRLGPVNTAEPDVTLPSRKTWTRPSLSANRPCQLLSSAL